MMAAPRNGAVAVTLLLALLFCLLANGITAGAAAVASGEIEIGGHAR